MTAPKEIARGIASRRKEIASLDNEFIGEVIGVAQAIAELRKALNKVSACLDSREFEKASSLGYRSVSEMYVFLQRTLGGLQAACSNKDKLIGEIAYEARRPYEEVRPHVDAVMESPHPLSEEERKKARKAWPELKAKIRAMTGKAKSATKRRASQ